MSTVRSIFGAKANKSVFSTMKNKEEDKVPNKLFINLGIPVLIADSETGEETETFINLPLTLTADSLEDVIANEQHKLNRSNSEKFQAIQTGKIVLAELVKELFERLEPGQSMTTADCAESEEFVTLSNLQIQFYHSQDVVAKDNTAVKANILEAFKQAGGVKPVESKPVKDKTKTK